jgi:hypothetical protein
VPSAQNALVNLLPYPLLHRKEERSNMRRT